MPRRKISSVKVPTTAHAETVRESLAARLARDADWAEKIYLPQLKAQESSLTKKLSKHGIDVQEQILDFERLTKWRKEFAKSLGKTKLLKGY